jgi:hypothetical protein
VPLATHLMDVKRQQHPSSHRLTAATAPPPWTLERANAVLSSKKLRSWPPNHSPPRHPCSVFAMRIVLQGFAESMHVAVAA